MAQVILSIPKDRAIKVEKTANGPQFDQNWQPGPRAALALTNGINDEFLLLVSPSKSCIRCYHCHYCISAVVFFKILLLAHADRSRIDLPRRNPRRARPNFNIYDQIKSRPQVATTTLSWDFGLLSIDVTPYGCISISLGPDLQISL